MFNINGHPYNLASFFALKAISIPVVGLDSLGKCTLPFAYFVRHATLTAACSSLVEVFEVFEVCEVFEAGEIGGVVVVGGKSTIFL